MIRIIGRRSDFTWHTLVDGMGYKVVHTIAPHPDASLSQDYWRVFSIKSGSCCLCDPRKRTHQKVLAEVKAKLASEPHL